MSSYNYIEKIRYNKSPSDVVSLEEYILYEDDRAMKKAVMFKFRNNVSQRLYSFKFEVLQYDAENKLLERSIAVYSNSVYEANAEFVPEAKLEVNYYCKSIIVNLVFAQFDRVKWEKGEFVEGGETFEHFAQGTAPATAKGTGARRAAKAVPAAVERPQKKKVVIFSVSNISNRNVAILPKVFNIIMFVLFVACIVVATLLFVNNSDIMYLEGFDVRKVSDNQVNICGYDGFDTELVIPDKIGEYTVNKVEENAFKGKGIKRLEIQTTQDIEIESGAFAGCKSLQSVSANANVGNIIVFDSAFENCTSLEEFNLPTAKLSENSLAGDSSVNVLIFDKTVSGTTPLKNLFGEEEEKISIQKMEANLAKLPADFFENVTVKEFKLLNANCDVEYGALKSVSVDGYTSNEYCELIYGTVRSMRVLDDTLVLPKETVTLNISAFTSKLQTVKKLKLETTGVFELMKDDTAAQQFFHSMQRLTSLEITDTSAITTKTLGFISGLEEFISPVLGSSLNTYLKGSDVTKIGVTGNRPLTAAYLSNLSGITGISVASTVPSVAQDAFAQLNLTSLAIPVYSTSGTLAAAYNGLTNLTEVELRASSSNKTVPANYLNGLNKLTAVTIADGVETLRSNLVSSANLRKFVTLGTLKNVAEGTISDKCTRLETVVVRMNTAPQSYEWFNKSCAATRNLSIYCESGNLGSDFFVNCKNLYRLSLGSGVGITREGLLKNCREIDYLELHSDNCIAVQKLFASTEEAPSYVELSTLVVYGKTVAEGMFEETTTFAIDALVLKDVTEFSGNPFKGCTSLTELYLPDTIKYTQALFQTLPTTGKLYAEGEAPVGVTKPKNATWKSKAFEKKLYDFVG